jgi:hypothetical protein
MNLISHSHLRNCRRSPNSELVCTLLEAPTFRKTPLFAIMFEKDMYQRSPNVKVPREWSQLLNDCPRFSEEDSEVCEGSPNP